MKILIAEDDRDIALFCKVVLEARYHHVVSPDNGEDHSTKIRRICRYIQTLINSLERLLS